MAAAEHVALDLGLGERDGVTPARRRRAFDLQVARVLVGRGRGVAAAALGHARVQVRHLGAARRPGVGVLAHWLVGHACDGAVAAHGGLSGSVVADRRAGVEPRGRVVVWVANLGQLGARVVDDGERRAAPALGPGLLGDPCEQAGGVGVGDGARRAVRPGVGGVVGDRPGGARTGVGDGARPSARCIARPGHGAGGEGDHDLLTVGRGDCERVRAPGVARRKTVRRGLAEQLAGA